MALGRQMRWVRCAGCVAGLSCLAAMCCGAAAGHVDTSSRAKTHLPKRIVAMSPWEQAERGRETLEAIPEDGRMKADYARAMEAYRAIYHAHPGDAHAPAAVNAVAELLVEQGRGQHDVKSLQAAVGQYEFLRKQYPGSSLRVQALLVEGQIEEDDLGDAAAAREKYKLLLKQHPKSEQADEARAGLASLEQLPVVRSPLSGKVGQKDAAESHVSEVRSAATGSTAQGEPRPQGLKPGSVGSTDGIASASLRTGSKAVPLTGQSQGIQQQGSSLPSMAQTSGAVEPTHASPTSRDRSQGTTVHDRSAMNAVPTLRDGAAKDGAPDSMGAVVDVAADTNSAKRSGKRALVTGIRHWSTATYTRVAIDLRDNVTYEAARVPNPDRIYFDLHGARLAQELVGKSFAVTDDGFLKKVRAAQYTDDVTRVVLDVNDVTEYSAFLLPDPYRLIIDIHGGPGGAKEQGTGNREQPALSRRDTVTSVDVPAPHTAATVKPTAAKPVPNTVATKNARATSEVADISEMPGRVDATSQPTSKPISAVVDDQGSSSQVRGSRDDRAGSGAGISQSALGTDPTHRDETAMNGAPALTEGSKKTRRSRTKAAAGSNAAVADATPARAATPMADGETSLVRALGLKIGRIVIDAGHGGHDSGTLGADGIQEKDVVLDVALRLGKLLHDRLGAEIIYTRSDDTFIPLETRTAIANKAQADLFLSIHANSSSDASARGVETYYLNFTSDPTALDVAARENAVSDQSIHQLSDLVKKIALKNKIAESREFAADVEESLYGGLQRGNAGLKDRGVKKAPFVVLIGANMPSILAEISFVTNPKDAAQLQEPDYRQRVAESLYKGVARYQGGLSGTRVATERASVGQ
jgi:N-acetylmuramoyl-L-alanine amidase